ncbi:MFS transporter [Nibribacter ruber]|uniref:MFS transporter n=1 Tax=Nibribacter ruber TaxID=2698458 RepID=A0A6P1NXL2_9BACT|nr:peptide MFS transporter [Nibribacter ruber]QHL87750.1 MFS transporter [Nibribacter ruber]
MSQSTAKHPKGLYFLFLAEMWERFGYYLMIGIFFLYMTDAQSGGMGMPKDQASDIYGTFIALVFLTPFIGGLLADRLLGYRLSITLGGLLMGLGYCGLGLPGDSFFYLSLALIVIGNGFFKANISTLLGNLYSEKQYLPQKDAGYNIFYMGINVGAFICNFVAAYLRNTYGWSFAFVAAGIGMFIGLIIFWVGNSTHQHADIRKPAQPHDMSLLKIVGTVIFPAAIVGILSWVLIPGSVFGSDSTDAFIFGSIPIILFYVSLWARASKEDKRPIAALLSIFAVVIVFWAVFKQNGTALTIWAEYYTDRSMPAPLEKPAANLGMVQSIDASIKTVPDFDNAFRTRTDAAGKVVTKEGMEPYVNNLAREEWPSEGKPLSLISTELFQSINPFFVIILTPLVVSFWGFMRRRGKEPSTPAKMAWGLFITGLSTLVMVGAVWAGDNGQDKVSSMWLVGTYFVVTIGELCLSPMGLSLVSKVSPPRLTALLMGGWFMATSIGNKLSGILASLWDTYDDKQYFFWVNFAVTVTAAAVLLFMLKWLRQIMENPTGDEA